ncbi:DUF7133 domain-containing protein [Zavarzinella formosa]|uniref:DUF7133 domain-containing protein n=1 Tax=Zavarzinella formosa TaxID=360055 RepID=UPI00138B1201|nr:discoidin domain-containing protein [Zavarzinella formosa]
MLAASHLATGAPPAMVPENLAKGKPATASSSQDESRNAAKGNDGDPESRWCANGAAANQWWQVDLGKPEDITGCRVVWEKDEANYRYKIEGSEDAKTWKPLVDQTKGNLTEQTQTHQFSANGLRYVRITITSLPSGCWASFHEFEVLGKKLVPADPKSAPVAKGPKLQGVTAPAGFNLTMFAAPPDISYPTCLAAAPDGTVFVGVDLNGSLGAKPGKGKIVRCIDTDGDGKADKFNTFTEVDSPRGLWWDNNTLYVLHPPTLSAYHDTNGDGVADKHEVLVKGIGFDLKFRGADHTTNGFRMGIDGWMYMAIGDYGFLKAEGTDGRTLQLRGGGIVRVRPDGSGLELVCDGQRNIYDVAVSPTLDLFTRDNTNDGGGWDVRLAHNIMTGHYGYPRLFVNFPEEIIKPLFDYGGGSPTGSLYLDEPGFPEGFGTGLYTCEWGRSSIDQHPLKPNGSTYKADKKTFLQIPAPTDMDVDGSGRFYASSWKGGGFDFSNPNVGFVVRVTDKDWKLVPFPDLKKATDEELVGHVGSNSHTRRLYAQREILRRGAKPLFAEKLEQLAAKTESPAVAVAAIFTLKQLLGEKSNEALLRLMKQQNLREYAIKAMADHLGQLGGVSLQPFVEALKDANPRVRLQAVIALNRLNKIETAGALLPLTADEDPVVSHIAINALVSLRACDACLKALDSAETSLHTGALRVLQSLHEVAVVDGLLARLAETKDEKLRQGILRTLARLSQQEAEWDGKWWTTRPDTRGPYYNPVAWKESEKIRKVLKDALVSANAETLRWLIPELYRNRVELPEISAKLLTLAKDDPAFHRMAVNVFAAIPNVPEEAVPLFISVADNPKEPEAERARALRVLAKLNGNPKAREAMLDILTKQEKLPSEIEKVWLEFVRDGRQVDAVAEFVKMIAETSPAKRELAFGVLATIADRNFGNRENRAVAEKAVLQAWTNPQTALPLLKAVTRLNLTSYAPQIRPLIDGADPQLATAAKATMASLKIEPNARNLPTISKMKPAEVMPLVLKEKGNVEVGARLFNRSGCVNCHTVSPSETPKGPSLAGIAARYSRNDLLESILQPSAKMAQGFETHIFELSSGKKFTGFVTKDTVAEIELRDGNGVVTIIKKSDIEDRKTSKVSVMPEKLADNLTVPELASLLAYLESLKGK